MINVIKWTFAVGHVFNDLCASMWFLYTMPYFTKVLKLENYFAGYIILIGQVADGIATPLIGILCDRIGICCHNYIGKRKSWHLLGTILCAISFPFIFHSFLHVKNVTEGYLVLYYASFVVIFQIAWAIVQITHLSLIPVLMRLGQDNSSLNSLRYMFTVAANVIILTATTVLFNQSMDHKNSIFKNSTNITPSSVTPSPISLSPSDQSSFTYLTIGVVVLGLFFSLIFHLGVPEKQAENLSDDCSMITNSDIISSTPLLHSFSINMRIRDWFKEPQFYLINILYLTTRLIVNVSQSYLILYVIDGLQMTKIQSSLAALTSFVSGVISSLLLKKVLSKIGPKNFYLSGIFFIMVYCTIVTFTLTNKNLWEMYLSFVFLGIGSSLIMVGSLTLTAELIGKSCSSSAFVYGTMSFSDKMVCGIAIFLMQQLGPKLNDCQSCNKYYRNIELYFVGGSALFAFVILLIIYPMKIGTRWKEKRSIMESNINSNDENDVKS